MIVSFFGQMATAKDTAADYLVDQLNLISEVKWQRTAFANAVKDTFCNSFGVSRDFIEQWKRKSEIPDGLLMPLRQALQFIGDGFRKIKPNIWIEIALRNDDPLIISDGRYLNESKEVKLKKGLSIVLYRDGFVNDDPNPSESQMKPIASFCAKYLKDGPIPCIEELTKKYTDIPEGIENFDFFIHNDGTKEDFYQKIDSLLVPFVLNYYNLRKAA